MNKLKLSKLNSAVDKFYRLAQKSPLANGQTMQDAENLTNSRIQSIMAINPKQLSLEEVRQRANEMATSKTQASSWLDLQSKLITLEQFQRVMAAVAEKIKQAETAQTATPQTNIATKPTDKAAPTPAAKPAVPKKPTWWGTPEMMKVVQKIQEFLMGVVGKEAFGPTGADGKWGPKSQTALRTWLTHTGKKGTGYLDETALYELSKFIPEVKAYYTKVFNKDPQLGF